MKLSNTLTAARVSEDQKTRPRLILIYLIYKDMYKELTNIIKDNRINLERYQNKIIELQNENQTLRQEYKSHIFNSNIERETLMNTIQRERSYMNKKNSSEDSKRVKNKKLNKKDKINNNSKMISITETCDNSPYNQNNKNKFKKFLDGNDKNKKNDERTELTYFNDDYFLTKINKKQFEHEDFIEIIKTVGLTLEKFEYMSKLKSFSKFTEIIEMLLNLVKDRERYISILKRRKLNVVHKYNIGSR